MIEETVAALHQNKVILYPTDTVWGIGGDATNAEVVKKIYKLKQREDHKALIVLVDSIEMLKSCVENIPEQALYFINSEQPTTLIYPKGIGFAIPVCRWYPIAVVPVHSFEQGKSENEHQEAKWTHFWRKSSNRYIPRKQRNVQPNKH